MTYTHPAVQAHDGAHRAALAVRGVLAIALGAVALWHPGYATGLIVAFAVFAIVDGAIRLGSALRGTQTDRAWWVHALEGVVGIAFGVVAVRVVHGLIALTWTIAEWAGIIGILGVVLSVAAWGRLRDAWLWLLGAILTIVLAIGLLWETRAGLFTPGLALGAFALVYGIITLVIAVRPPTRAPAASRPAR
jgi:uncharacterized membrane protein HdeD (DUF308 family)